MVPEERLELTRACTHWILSPARLPIPPLRQQDVFYLPGCSDSSSRSQRLNMSLEISHLSISSSQQPILKNLSFSTDANSILAVLGPSGSGKTTLVRAILGLLKNLNIEGEIKFAGDFLQKDGLSPLSRKARRFGYIPQNLSLWPHLTMRETLMLAARWSGHHDRVWLDELIDLLGLGAHLLKKPKEISGGEQQRLALARALIAKPRLIIFDEPLSALDIIAKAEIINHIKNSQIKLGFSGILITHDLAEALMLADSILILFKGKKIWHGPSAAIHNATFPRDWPLLSSPFLRPLGSQKISNQQNILY